jgi:hypothetical protein
MKKSKANLLNQIHPYAAGFPPFLHSCLWSYAAKCVTQLENTIVDSSAKSASQKFVGRNPNGFGEIGITYNNQKIKGILDNTGFP